MAPHRLLLRVVLFAALLGCATLAAGELQIKTDKFKLVSSEPYPNPGPRHSASTYAYGDTAQVGFQFAFNEDLWETLPLNDDREKTKIGFWQGYCIVTASGQTTNPPFSNLECAQTFYFLSGVGTYQDAISTTAPYWTDFPDSNPIIVVGGVGKYAGAWGTVLQDEDKPPTVIGDLTFHEYTFTINTLVDVSPPAPSAIPPFAQ